MTGNRVSALIVLAFALVLGALVIPAHTEPAFYGLSPQLMPMICAVTMGVAALFQLAMPMGQIDASWPVALRVGGYLGFAFLCLWIMSLAGFLPGAIVLGLGVMLAVGERRLLWLVSGGLVVPAFLWFVVEVLLDRPLP
jgi:putative tricarboxylic transport membrane protein